ncbi:hypothetical protein [Methanobrevibacter sp.]|uniref:hypothetical protein n=1 Tax=Methanobrevibacter sp. TaxID=66852 RepID=UPI002580FDC3|nr:hypothetical protein [Methanobrevibacter sp.]MBR2666518.1 hypothetical protein [Methanobrevibacter sp.]
MDKYPMDYEEYEKRVIELFLKTYPKEKRETVIARLDGALKEDSNLIRGMYGESCFRYDNPNIYGDNSKKVFEDYLLESIPVNTLHMLLGGSFD